MVDFRPKPRTVALEEWVHEKVSSLISLVTHQWDRARLYQRFDAETISHILRLPLLLDESQDRWIWSLSSTGQYSTRTMYRALLPQFDEDSSPLPLAKWKLLWKLKVHAGLRLLLWKIACGISCLLGPALTWLFTNLFWKPASVLSVKSSWSLKIIYFSLPGSLSPASRNLGLLNLLLGSGKATHHTASERRGRVSLSAQVLCFNCQLGFG